MSQEETTETVEQIISQIRTFEESVEVPDNWRILIPVDNFNEVKEELDTTFDLGSYYNGISLCYTTSFDRTRVEYKSNLSDHLGMETDL